MEQAVLVYFSLSDSGFGSAWEREVLGGLDEDLAAAVAEAAVGEFDGNDIGEGQCTFYLYGPNADELFEAIQPLLVELNWPGEIAALKRYGPPGASEVRVPLRGGGPRDN